MNGSVGEGRLPLPIGDLHLAVDERREGRSARMGA